MAKKKQLKPLEDPPMAPSSDEEEAEALSGDDDEEEEEQISDDSSSEEKDDDFIPKNDSLAWKKRQIDLSYSVNAKRAKIAEEAKKKKKPPTSQRVWSEGDEVSILQGMIDFKGDTGKSPYEEMDRFYELTSKSISFEASKRQFLDKIRKLKRKYMGKVKEGVESLTWGHDIECLRLAERIWGSHGMAIDSNVNKTEKKVVEEEVAPESAAKSNGTPKKSKKKKKHVSVEGDGDKVEVLVNGENGGEDREELAGDESEKGKEDSEVLANGEKDKEHQKRGMALDSNVKKTEKKVVEEEVAPESAAKSNGTPKKSKKKKKKHVSLEGDGDKVEVLVNGKNGGEDREELAGGEKGEEDTEVLANGDKDKEVLISGGGASDWFEDSFLVGSIAGLGVSEQFVKQNWSTVTVEMKKRMEEKWKLLQDKEMELVMHKADFMREIVSVIAEAT